MVCVRVDAILSGVRAGNPRSLNFMKLKKWMKEAGVPKEQASRAHPPGGCN